MQFHLLSFEGPDPYSSAGGIASRISGLASSLAEAGHDTHLWFVGDPKSPGHERARRRGLRISERPLSSPTWERVVHRALLPRLRHRRAYQ